MLLSPCRHIFMTNNGWQQTGRSSGRCNGKNELSMNKCCSTLPSYFDTRQEQLFLVFDFGGGTLDVSIVDCFDTMVEILAVSGDNHLGGDDFNEAIAGGFLKEHQLQQKYLSETEYAILLRQAEKCKIALSTLPETKMTAVIGGQTYQSVYTNERVMRESSGIWKRMQRVLRHALQDGRVSLEEINAVILAGGSGKMPLVQSYMEQLFEQTPLVTGFSDQLIARGLGLVCGVMERKDEVRDYVLTDICPFTLGTSVNNDADHQHPYMSAIIERNTVLPCSRVQRYYTVSDYQSEVKVDIRRGRNLMRRIICSWECSRYRFRKRKKGKNALISVLLTTLMAFWKWR